MPQPRFLLLAAALLAALALVSPARAADDFAQQFRGAELAETAFGDLADAAARYRTAAGVAPDAASKARAELRAGSCLRRLGKIGEARTLLDPLLAGENVPEEIRRAARAELAEASVVPPPPP
jgi:tetratricopeptide (TPR) repeat protein